MYKKKKKRLFQGNSGQVTYIDMYVVTGKSVFPGDSCIPWFSINSFKHQPTLHRFKEEDDDS